MTARILLSACLAVAATSTSVSAEAVVSDDRDMFASSGQEDGKPYLQCVPYARQVSGIQIYGDAWTWWGQAEGKYKRGSKPRIGAVMAFQPYRNMQLGHVAAVSRIIDSRTVLLRHSNWSPINGRRGQIEDNVRAIDVSPENDWSVVRVWYAPIQGVGKTSWPVRGFIYNDKSKPLTETKLVRSADKAKKTKPGKDPIGLIIAARL